MKTIILDTNFLIYILKYKIDLEEELNRIIQENYKLIVLDRSIEELKNIKGNLETKTLAKFAIKYIQLKNIKIIKTEENKHVDDLIRKQITKDTIVATQDRELKLSLKCPVIIIRQKKYLSI